MEIMSNRLDRGYFSYQKEFEMKALDVLRSGRYILGDELKSFEKEFSDFVGTRRCVGVASGLDALYIAFKILGIGPGDEVIVQGNTYIASIMGITMNGGTPVFVEPDIHYGIDPEQIEKHISSKTKAVLAVHLYGIPCDMEEITAICHRHGLKLVEDCAQSHGARYKGRMTGTFGDIGCFSFYPSKNLGAFGDAGAIVTSNEDFANEAIVIRNYGSDRRYYNKVVGVNSRLDEIQAGLLRVRLQHIREITEERMFLARRYSEFIKNPLIQLPMTAPYSECVWHQYIIQCKERSRLIDFLESYHINTLIHYPIPPHLSEAYKYLNITKGSLPITERLADSVLSLPLYNGMTTEEQDYVINIINKFN